MPIPPEILRLINSKIAPLDSDHVSARNRKIAELKAEYASRGLGRSGPLAAAIIDARVKSHIERVELYTGTYLETLGKPSVTIDRQIEQEIANAIEKVALLYVGGAFRQLVGNDRGMSSLEAMDRREMESAGNNALRKARARIEEARLYAERVPESTQQLASAITNNYIASGPNARVNHHSNDYSVNTIEERVPATLDALIALSAGNPSLHDAANETKAAWPEKTLTTEKLSKWVTLASSSASLMEKAAPYLHHLYQVLASSASGVHL